MKVSIISVGRFKQGPLLDLYTLYKSRLPWKIDLFEIDPKLSLDIPTSLKQQKEGELIQAKIPSDTSIITLDEKGQLISSLEMAELLKKLQENAIAPTFIIGGADGLSEDLKKKAHKSISFGRCTWPHLMVRVLLVEQIYRAHQILIGHPYHRE